MSPEQVAADPLDLDTRSDVYALGLILYEIVADRLPYDLARRAVHDAMRIILVEDPPALSSIDRRLGGDVETIVSKALEKDKTRRYAAARDLATDIRRYLNDQPILARPASAAYQLRKFARRNRALVAGVATALVALSAGTVVSSLLALRARRAEALAVLRQREAEQDAARERAVSGFLTDILQSANPEYQQGRALTVRDVIGGAAQRATSPRLANAPTVRADIESTIATTYESLGEYDSAWVHAESALAIYSRTADPEDTLVGWAELALAGVAEHTDSVKAARVHALRAVAIFGRHLPYSADADVSARIILAEASYRTGAPPDSAIAMGLEALARARLLHRTPDTLMARAMELVAQLYSFSHQGMAAESLYRQANAIFTAAEGSLSYNAINTLQGRAYSLGMTERSAEAEPLYRDLLPRVRRVYGDSSLQMANAYERFGVLLLNQHRLAEAAPLLDGALAIRLRRLGALHPDVQLVRTDLGRLYRQQHRYADAERLFMQALTVRRSLLGPSHPAVASSLEDLGNLFKDEHRFARAVQNYRQALVIWDQGHWLHYQVLTRRDLAEVLMADGRLDSAQVALERVVADTRRESGDSSAQMGLVLEDLGKLAAKQGHKHVADSLLRAAAHLEKQP